MRIRIYNVVTPVLLATVLPSFAAARDDSAAEKLGFKLSLQCSTYYGLTFFDAVDKAAGLGIKYLEAFPGEKLRPGSHERMGPDLSDAAREEIRKKLAAAGGLKLVAIGVCGLPVDEKGARKMYEWAKKMGIEVLVTETEPNAIHDKLCTEFNIRYALHNHPQSWPPEKVLKFCKGRCKLIGSCSDTGHWMRANRVPVDTLKMLEGRVEHLHFKDLNEFGKGYEMPWGDGKGNAAGMLAELKRQGYKGYLSIEYEDATFDELAKSLPLCVKFFDETCTELAK